MILEDEGPKTIEQFEVEKWEILAGVDNTMLGSKKMLQVTISIHIRLKFESIFMVTYLPTILMNIINQATNYLSGDSKFDMIITVNITSMMVLASIYLSVSTSLPSTPTIKPVEIWLLFNLFYPFLVIIINILLQVQSSFWYLSNL